MTLTVCLQLPATHWYAVIVTGLSSGRTGVRAGCVCLCQERALVFLTGRPRGDT